MKSNPSIKEQWLPVVGYEGLYLVSDTGRVVSLPRNNTFGRELKQSRSGIARNYLSVSLSKNGISKHTYVHRIVASAFVINQLDLAEVNHKDGVTTNNNSSNLEWVTRKQNVEHAIRSLGRVPHFASEGWVACRGEKSGQAKLSELDVLYIKRHPEVSLVSLGKKFNVSSNTVRCIRIGRTWKHLQTT